MTQAASKPRRADLRPDLRIIADMIEPGSRVLDIGCGDGALLQFLVNAKGVDGRGVEISHAGVHACVSHGLSVIQGDADTDLKNYPSGAFDYAVLSETLQATHNPRGVLTDLVRIGRRAIVSFTNYGHWRMRWRMLIAGRMPVYDSPHHHWYDTPNIHLCTIRDFVVLCDELGLTIDQSLSLDREAKARVLNSAGFLANLRGEQGVFKLSRG